MSKAKREAVTNDLSTLRAQYKASSGTNKLEKLVDPSVFPNVSDKIASRYQFLKRLGQGTQGEVYEAVRNSDGVHVAIKVLNIDSIQNWKEYDLFWREVETLKSLDMPGIAKFYEAVEDLEAEKPHAYLVQQLIHGQSLEAMIKSGFRLNMACIFEIGIQLIDLLEALHKHSPSVIHRDIKPSNIILEPKGKRYKLYLIDFGAVANPVIQKGGSTVAGTYGYMPPEQLMGNPTPASDIYAAGALLAGILSGMSPSEMEVSDYRLMIEKPLEHLPHAVVSCLRLMTLPDQDKRLVDYSKIREAFSGFVNGQYNDNLDETRSTKASDYNKALKQVSTLGAPGNIDLWLQLPEQTPRRIPRCYRMMKNVSKGWGGIWLNQHNLSFFLSNPFAFICNWFASLFTVLCFAGFVLIYIIREIPFCLFLVVFSPVVIAFFVLIYLIRSLGRFCTGRMRIPVSKLFSSGGGDSELAIRDKIGELIMHGRKSMAMVVSIDYVGTGTTGIIKSVDDFNLIEYRKAFDDCDWASVRSDKPSYCGAYNNSVPRFRIRYAFNPPDDASEYDIIHECFFPYNPEGTLHVGDLIPILYQIDKDNKEKVMSMPFPIPLDLVSSEKDVICEINGRELLSLD